VFHTTTHEETEKVGEIVLSLVIKESAVRGDPIEVWQGKITTDPDQIKNTPRTVIRALIDQYGKNFEDGICFPRNKESTY
jgi:hypothetical protein